MNIQTACALVATLLTAGAASAQIPEGGVVTTGEAEARPCGVTTACTPGRQVRAFMQTCGTITASDGSKWELPAPITDGPAAVDIYNDCTGQGDNPDYLDQVETVVIDPDGEEITGYIFADNYYELWVNGTFIARDSLGMTPFNSTVVRFKAKYPITYAVKAVDWDTHPGLGMEYDGYNVGDGGFIAKFSDGTVTGSDWKVETFYIAPLDDPSCVKVDNGRDSTGCPAEKRGRTQPPCRLDGPQTCKALLFEIPEGWTKPGFDDTAWADASLYTAAQVTRTPGYARYADLFEPARFIWTRNLLLDNLVLARFTVDAPPE